MYAVIQFSDIDGGTLSIVNKNWLTPRKCQVHWPPVKGSKDFNRYLPNPSPTDKWKIYGIQRVFYETDCLEKAKQKLKLVEVTSDLASENEEELVKPKRAVKPRRHHVESSSDDELDSHVRPPPLKKAVLQSLKSQINILSDIALPSYSTPKKQYIADPLNTNGTNYMLGNTQSSNHPINTNETDEIPKNTQLILPGTDSNISNLPTTSNHPINTNETNEIPKNTQLILPGTDSIISNLPTTSSYQDKVVSLLAHIKTQNDIIMSILQNKGNTAISSTSLKPEFKFPLETFEDLEIVEKLLTVKENYANVVAYFKSLGGQGINNKVSRVMKYALSDSMATKFNFYGKRSDKKPFAELRLRATIVESLKSAEITEKHIEDSIKVWLKHAPERAKKRLSREGRT